METETEIIVVADGRPWYSRIFRRFRAVVTVEMTGDIIRSEWNVEFMKEQTND